MTGKVDKSGKSGFKLRWLDPFRVEREGNYVPFFWYGMRTRHWLKLLASGGFRITYDRIPDVLGVTLLAPLSSALHYLSEAVFRRRAKAVEIVPPVFVLGHWRSGTTFLHNLIACDPAMAFPTTLECVFPGGFLVARPVLGRSLSWLLPEQRPMDNMPLATDSPFEDEFALVKLGIGSPYASLAFPRQGPPSPDYLDLSGLTDKARKRWEIGFLWLMRRLQFAKPGRRLIIKSPPHTARIRTLLKLFPDARFVHISRDPYEIYPSTLKLWKVLNSRVGLQHPTNDADWLPEYVLSTLPEMYAAYERDKSLIPPGRHVEIRYEDLISRPKATVDAVYAALDLGDFAPVGRAIDAYLATLGQYRPNTFTLRDCDRRAVEERWSAYFDRFGYERSPR